MLSLWEEGVYVLCSFLRVRVFFMVLYLCRHWLLSCVRCLDDPGAGIHAEYQQSPLSFALSLSRLFLSYMNIHGNKILNLN